MNSVGITSLRSVFPSSAGHHRKQSKSLSCVRRTAFFALCHSLRKRAFDVVSQHEKSAVLWTALCFCVVIRLGFEPKTHSLEGCCSIQLSYRTDPYCFRVSAGLIPKVGANIAGFVEKCKMFRKRLFGRC